MFAGPPAPMWPPVTASGWTSWWRSRHGSGHGWTASTCASPSGPPTLAAAGAGPGPADVLAGGGRRSARAAAAIGTTRRRVRTAPRRAGRVGIRRTVRRTRRRHRPHRRGAGRSRSHADLAELQPALVAKASSSSVESFSRDMGRLERILLHDDGLSAHERCRRDRKVKRWRDRHTGMCHTHLQLDAETDAKVAAGTGRLPRCREGGAAGPEPDLRPTAGGRPRRADHPPRSSAAGRRTAGPGGDRAHRPRHLALRVARARRQRDRRRPPTAPWSHCAGCAVTPRSSLSSSMRSGVAVDVGPTDRVATRHQRRALRAMHATCAHPSCARSGSTAAGSPRRAVGAGRTH